MTVLVTGATGFIGLHLVEALVRRGDAVRCLVRPTSQISPLQRLGVQPVQGDIGDPQALSRATTDVDLVFHVAGIVKAFRSSDFYRVNTQGTAGLLEICAEQTHAPRVVLVSSIAAAGPTTRVQIRREADPPAPVSHYGRSKLGAEQVARKLAAHVPITIVRPGIVFGPRDTGFVQVLQSIRKLNCHLSPGFNPPRLSLIHVEDLVTLMLASAYSGQRLAMEGAGDPGSGCYFAVAPECPTYAEIGRMVAPMLGRKSAPVIPIPAPVAYCMAGLNELIGKLRGRAQELCIDKIRDALVPSWACSGETARRELGFEPTKPLALRLQETVDWCIQNKCL